MWMAKADLKYTCNNCRRMGIIARDDVRFEQVGGDERSMGASILFQFNWEAHCECRSLIYFEVDIHEYPIGMLNGVFSRSDTAELSLPAFEVVVPLYYLTDDQLDEIDSELRQLMEAVRQDPRLLREVEPHQFEEIVAELFRGAGYEVELTARTRDGGKDIIAINRDSLGIGTKIFVECKRYSDTNPVGVDIVRQLYGVHSTKDGANKSILVTTSRATSGALDYVRKSVPSEWHLDIVDYDRLVGWLNTYGR